jgi:undecaprenyl-diphosphatase
MLTAAFWGLIQGLTEFLPVSSSGHLVLIPALLGIDDPDLATSAVLHLGTLAAVVWYYRSDLWSLRNFSSDPEARRVLTVLLVGTVPAAIIGLSLGRPIEIIFTEPWLAAVMLVVTGAVLGLSLLLPEGSKRVEEATIGDSAVVGWAQAFALLPGISRSGITITAAMAQGIERIQAARYAFLLGVPAIAGAGLGKTLDVIGEGGFEASLLVGVVVAAISGYFAITVLIRLLAKVGLAPFAIYCVVFGGIAYILV